MLYEHTAARRMDLAARPGVILAGLRPAATPSMDWQA
jgi:hypothetical protein